MWLISVFWPAFPRPHCKTRIVHTATSANVHVPPPFASIRRRAINETKVKPRRFQRASNRPFKKKNTATADFIFMEIFARVICYYLHIGRQSMNFISGQLLFHVYFFFIHLLCSRFWFFSRNNRNPDLVFCIRPICWQYDWNVFVRRQIESVLPVFIIMLIGPTLLSYRSNVVARKTLELHACSPKFY